MLVSVLIVTARETDLRPLLHRVAEQKLPATVQREVCLVSPSPVHREIRVGDLRIKHATPPNNWARRNGYRFLASARNESLLIAGEMSHRDVLCCAIDDDCLPERDDYLRELLEAARVGELLVPSIVYPGGTVRQFQSGNAATPFWLEDALDLNGYDELLDANWPGTPTYEDVDLCFRLKPLGPYTIKPSDDVRLLHGPIFDDSVRQLGGIKCNHTLRIAGSFMNWDTNAGMPPKPLRKIMRECPYLDHGQCIHLGRACEVPLNIARQGHSKLMQFIHSRPKREMMKEWTAAVGRRLGTASASVDA